MDDVLVVIRKNQERTSDVCRAIIEQQVPESQICIVTEKPFYKAVEKTLKSGGFSNRWLIAVDADVLLLPDAISRMCEEASRIKKDFFFYQGAVLDKFFMGYRPAGPHLYNCEHIQRSLELKNGFEQDPRPETFIRSKMKKEGFAYVQDQTVFGIHDFEQYYSDVYKKVFRHAQKHASHRKKIETLFNKFCDVDIDFAVAKLAINEATTNGVDVLLPDQDLDNMARKAIDRLDLSEKISFRPEDNNVATTAADVKANYFTLLGIDEQFLSQQRYFGRFNPYVHRLLKRLPFKFV